MEEIIIWETNLDVIRACEVAVLESLAELGLQGRITINSEPPLISRNKLWERLPVLEANGLYWSLTSSKPFTKKQLIPLFRKIFGM